MPALTEYLRPDVISKITRLDLRARFIVEGFYAGLHDSPYHGFSVEFSEHRKYTAGDDLRTIDWNVYGKTDRFYVKKYRAETNLSAYLLMDASASMGFPAEEQIEPGGSPRLTKFAYASCLAGALGYLMMHQQDAVGLAALGGSSRCFLPARNRPGHLGRLLAELTRLRPGGAAGPATELHEVARRVSHRGLMVLFTDLLCEPEALGDALHHLRYAGHDVIVFCVLDAAETTFPFRGPTRFEDVEDGSAVDGDADALRGDYLAALDDFLDGWRVRLAALRADFVRVDTSVTFDQALVRFVTRRRKRF